MKYITMEQFNKADTKVQQAILEWWKPSNHDLICYPESGEVELFDNRIMTVESVKEEYYPLLTEGQLREFIENRKDCKIDMMYSYINCGYEIFVESRCFEIKSDNLLLALWQVANKIIKGDVGNEEM